MRGEITKTIGNSIKAFLNPRSENIEVLYRKRLFTIYLLLFTIPLVLFGIVHIHSGLYLFGVINLILSSCFLIFIALLRRIGTHRVIFRLALAICVLLLSYWLLRAPEISFYPSIYVLTLPPFAFFLMGRREGFIWIALMIVITVIVFANPGSSLLARPYPDDYITRHLIALSLIVLFSYNYESVRERFKNAMESEQGKLVREKERLARAKEDVEEINVKLGEEIDTRIRTEETLRQHQDHLEELIAERTREINAKTRKLEASEERYRLLADNATDMIWAMDLDMHFTFISPSVRTMYGYSVDEAMSLPFDQWMNPDSMRMLMDEFRKQLELEKTGTADPNRHVVFELEDRRKDGSPINVELKVSFMRNPAGSAIGLVGITRDITERIRYQREQERLQEHLAQAQKLDALGTLVSGLSHDFNNILTGIMGSFDFLNISLKNQKLDDCENIERYLDIGIDSARRSMELIRQLLALSKKHSITLSPIDVNEPIRYVHQLCRNSLPKSVTLDFHFSEEPLIVMGDTLQIEQVLLNLCINASHSMTIMRPAGSQHGGVLTVRAELVHNDAGIEALSPQPIQGVESWVRIRVSDTGVGMVEETRRRIFEPFFSLKEKIEGTGLGLSISYNIIQKHGGFITVYSEPGEGSLFSLYIPFHNEDIETLRDAFPADTVHRGSGTILVIDDEQLVLETAKGLLEKCGYDVLAAGGAEEGIALYREHHGTIAAVLIDLSMPVKSGLEVFRELKKIRSDVRALLSSGMLDTESEETARAIGIMEMIHKPYMIKELSKKIIAIISRA
ncbi:MAG: PAS domain S-box protein [Spirochaetes bacterium]|nr:PAS domain S-box protein [Spirochaetota bacterium]